MKAKREYQQVKSQADIEVHFFKPFLYIFNTLVLECVFDLSRSTI